MCQHVTNALDHVGLVFNIARDYCNPRCPLGFDDLVQEGMIGLLKAAEKFDPTRGRPAPYFGRKIRWAMIEAIARDARQTERLIYCGWVPGTRDADTKSRGLSDGIPDHRSSEQRLFELAEWLDVLNSRERLVIELWFGIGRAQLTPREIGERLGVTRQRIWQIYGEAMDRIREVVEEEE